MDPCDAPADVAAWTTCHAEAVTQPVLDGVYLVGTAGVVLAIILAGVSLVRGMIRKAGRP